MKHGKNPTVAQMKLMEKKGLISTNWLVVKDTPSEMIVVHRNFENNVRRIVKAI